MKIYVVSYDLTVPDGDYTGVEAALSRCAVGEMLHFQKSVWLISSRMSASQIRDSVSPVLSKGDKLFVTHMDGSDWAGWGTKAQAWVTERKNMP